ncbi:hypothetical protein J2S78_002606 [Salibacterium salarium]|uniref:hypothetical protein n=1 Tax=Salibacterium salarium TaxID=284579 RepID=UPI002788CB3A|nr:hypothetical protein [Salibacterium salarium]MDQ0300159.1 hypothetical protein [Salibacterium salarium]
MKTIKQQETKLDENELIDLMLNIYQKVEDQTIETDQQLMTEVRNGLKPLLPYPNSNN